MSGIIGLFQRDEAPVDAELLRALTESLSFRGPDARETWSAGPIGLGHTMLRTTREAQQERQPACLDGRFWITADARIDCRAQLRKELEDAGRRLPDDLSDSELILHAYAAWQDDCVQHLRGDFAFAIWDQRRKELFCARDHFGIKPFYYAEAGDTFVFSNTLNCVRLHPGVSDELNDDAVLDFLIIGFNCDNSATTFKAVRRIPPAHFLKVSADSVRVSRYYSLPIDGRIRYKRDEDYIEHFRSVWEPAVADRLRSERVGIFLSGGLDSPTIAATARQVAPSVDLRAYTCVYESLIPDEEGKFASQVADFLHIPIRLLPMDHSKSFERSSEHEHTSPEPIDDPFAGSLFDEFQAVSADCRVALNGHGGDDIMDFQMWPYTRDMLRRGEWRWLLIDVPRFLCVRPLPWRGLWRRGQKLLGKGPLAPIVPDWITPQCGKGADIADRWNTRTKNVRRPSHPVLPRAHAVLNLPHWSRLFEMDDPGVTQFPVEVRYPFLDLRVVEYLLALPPFPCFFGKQLLRRAMSGRLPEAILRRKKTPLMGDPLTAVIQRGACDNLGHMPWNPGVERYIDLHKWRSPNRDMSPDRAALEVRPLCLNFWLQGVRAARYTFVQHRVPVEIGNG